MNYKLTNYTSEDLKNRVKEKPFSHFIVDDFLDKTNIFDEFEEILPDQEFGVLVLTILNNFKSEVILNDLLDIIEEAIKKIKYNNEQSRPIQTNTISR